MYLKIINCRVCKSSKLDTFIDLGYSPLANNLSTSSKSKKYPLKVLICNKCKLTQLSISIDKNILYKNYLYYSSYSKLFINHAKKLSKEIISRFKPSSILEIGSNDGYLLRNFENKAKINYVAIDPAKNIYKEVIKKYKVDYVNKFFNFQTSELLKRKYGKFDVIIALNVLAHNHNINNIFRGIHNIAHKKTKIIIEVGYFFDLIKNKAFDTIYHEHYFYFSLTSISFLLEKNSLFLNDVMLLKNIHTGSFRAYISQKKHKSSRLKNILKTESRYYLKNNKIYFFQKVIENIRTSITELILSNSSKTIFGYGAAAKSTVMINFLNLNNIHIEYIIDKNINKVGYFTPGTKIKIESFDFLLSNKPDLILIFAWNFQKEIIKEVKSYYPKMKFLIPMPVPKIIS